MEHRSRSGGRILADQLAIHGVTTAFGVPGESYLPLLDALFDREQPIRFITCRHEAGAANMAEAAGKLTGRPGVCLVTRGPGATHAAIGVHTAFQDSTPMILLIGQVERGMRGRDAFQEIEYRDMFRPMAKWVAEIDSIERIPEFIRRAFSVAMSGRRGPVVLSLPEDMLFDTGVVQDAPPCEIIDQAVGHDVMERFHAMLSKARRPLMIVGGGTWDDDAKADIEEFARLWKIPTCCSFRRQDHFDNEHPLYIGHLPTDTSVAGEIADADLVICVGSRLSETASIGYTLFAHPSAHQKLVHVHPGVEELYKTLNPDLTINAAPAAFAAAAKGLQPERHRDISAAADRIAQERSAFQAAVPRQTPLDLQTVIRQLRDVLPPDAITASGAGNYSLWLHRFFRWTKNRTQLAPTSGAMGYGVPAGVCAAILNPQTPVVIVAGDGCFMMSSQEIATAMLYDARPIILVVNNGKYGTIRGHQERNFPARTIGTELRNPDFAAYARSFGAFGEVVEATDEFMPAFLRARAAGTAAVIELRISDDVLAPGQTIAAIRAASLAARAETASAH